MSRADAEAGKARHAGEERDLGQVRKVKYLAPGSAGTGAGSMKQKAQGPVGTTSLAQVRNTVLGGAVGSEPCSGCQEGAFFSSF